MSPIDIAVHLESLTVVITHVQTQCFLASETIRATTSATTSTVTRSSRRTSAVGIVGIAYERELRLLSKAIGSQPPRVSVMRAIAAICIDIISEVHAFLHPYINDRFFLAVVNTCDLRHIRLLVVMLQLVDNGCRQVLQSRLHIVGKELLAVKQNLLHLLAVDSHLTILNLCTGQTLNEFFQYRPFRQPIGICIVYQRVLYLLHLWQVARHRHAVKQEIILLHLQQRDYRTASRHLKRLVTWLVTYHRSFHDILPFRIHI